MAGNHPPSKRPREDDHNESDIAAKRTRPSYSETLTVLIGRREEKFIIHKDKLSAKSKFFRAAISKEWKEGEEEL